mgnify:CR=1 FL=1
MIDNVRVMFYHIIVVGGVVRVRTTIVVNFMLLKMLYFKCSANTQTNRSVCSIHGGHHTVRFGRIFSLKKISRLCRCGCARRKKLFYYSCVFLGDFSTRGVHVREGFCEKGVYFNEHHNATRFTKKSREKKLFLVSSFFVVT